MNGILLIDKPEGVTSTEVVRRVSRSVAGKVGHLGTLDPFATGVLPLCVGDGTKIAQFLNTSDKSYDGIIQLGTATDTGDPTGVVVRTAAVPSLDRHRLSQIEQRFAGEYQQVPPMYSALKRDGIPLYKLARRGIEVERSARTVHIASLTLAQEGRDRLRFEVSCSKGTYVRVLAEDIAADLGTVAYLRVLRRLRFGGFELEQTVPLDSWVPDSDRGLVPLREALRHLPSVVLDAPDVIAASLGQVALLGRLAREGSLAREGPIVLTDPAGGLVAVVTRRGDRWAFARVLAGGPLYKAVPVC